MAVAEASRDWMRSNKHVDTLMKLKMSLVGTEGNFRTARLRLAAGSN
ncbi:hypothetical protein [Bradyrhizobium sp. CB3481]|nr:hypothetical protein [Bradyrhizobium sp. CB3481]WFU18985.1 hypothetical protein QA643_11900 [Bradyrhizobium sp. CB3481]